MNKLLKSLVCLGFVFGGANIVASSENVSKVPEKVNAAVLVLVEHANHHRIVGKQEMQRNLSVIREYIENKDSDLHAMIEFSNGQKFGLWAVIMDSMNDSVPEQADLAKALFKNERFKVESTMLGYTVFKNQPELFQILVDRGAKPSKENIEHIKNQIKFLKNFGERGAIENETLDQWKDILKKIEKEKNEKTKQEESSSSSSSSSSSK